MATVLQKLKEEGWYLSEDGLKKLNENGLSSDVKELMKRALDYDLRDLVTNGGLPNDITKSSKIELPSSGVVLQVVNVRNVSAPKVNQESKTSPRLLQIDFTDGQTLCSGLDLEHLQSFSINVAPGTKVLLKNTVKVVQGFLTLTPQNISILGGQVQALYEKWETNRTLAKFIGFAGQSSKKSNGDTLKGTPPPWISFGSKIKGNSDNDATFKSLNTTSKTKEVSKEDAEFIALRNSAIAEASAKGELRKCFGGNNRQLMDHNLKKILDKGYTEEQAKLALKIARNNLERAMSHLKKRGTDLEKRQKPTNETMTSNSRRGNKLDDHPPAKPSGKVSLFDFLSDKIPDVEPAPAKPNPRSTTANYSGKSQTTTQRNLPAHSSDNQRPSKFENNISTSFASRQTKDDVQPTRSKWNENSSNGNVSNRSNFQQYQSGQQQQQQQQHHQPAYKSNQQPSHKNQSSFQNSGNNNYQQSDKNMRYSTSNNNAPPMDQQTNKRDNKRPNTSANAKHQTNMKNLIESTANLQLNNENNQQKQSQPQQQQQQQQQQQHKVAAPQSSQQSRTSHFEEMFPQAKRFPYNPYKIMGFQNRETNEFAMNVLKTQMNANDQKPTNCINNTNTGTSNAYVPVSRSNHSMDANNCQPKIKHNQHIQQQKVPIVPVHHNVPAPKPNFISPSVPVPYNMSALPPPPPPQAYIQSWNFKVGDRCLAKYWEDEKYYNAEIQAVTDKTCVVHFLEYGNSEEVLHNDLLPITDANHQPINQFNGIQASGPIHPVQAYPPLAPNKAGPPAMHFHQNNYPQHQNPTVIHTPPQIAHQSQRFMANRQVYIPPAQRK